MVIVQNSLFIIFSHLSHNVIKVGQLNCLFSSLTLVCKIELHRYIRFMAALMTAQMTRIQLWAIPRQMISNLDSNLGNQTLCKLGIALYLQCNLRLQRKAQQKYEIWCEHPLHMFHCILPTRSTHSTYSQLKRERKTHKIYPMNDLSLRYIQ